MQKDKVRIYVLARELNMESKDLVDLCRAQGLDVKNQLSSLEAEERDAIELLIKKGKGGIPASSASRSAAQIIPVVPSPVPNLSSRRPVKPSAEAPRSGSAPEPEVEVASPVETETETPVPGMEELVVAPTVTSPAPEQPGTELEPTSTVPTVAASAAEATVPGPSARPGVSGPSRPSEPGGGIPPPVSARVPDLGARGPAGSSGRMPDLNQPRSDRSTRRPREAPRPVIAPRPKPPPPLKPVAPKEEKKQQIMKPIMILPTDARNKGPNNVQDLINKAAAGESYVPPVADVEEDEANKGKKDTRPGQLQGRDKRHAARNERAKIRRDQVVTEVVGGKIVAALTEEERRRRGRSKHKQPKQKLKLEKHAGRIAVTLPLTVRSLCEAIGLTFAKMYGLLQAHGAPPTININSNLAPDLAELVAIDAGCELEIKRPPSAEEDLLAVFQRPDPPEALLPRAPIVTIMGHVDHGKTSLLDKIRKSNVVATEAGGITQVIRAWRVDHGDRPITFLDTPGHEAFTKMRARGAQVTDIAVIVVAADDGVMPQTQEAINHAKAAGVSLVVAINKIDMPQANLNRTRQQLYSLDVLPDNMGGDTPFVETSAATGKGIDELLDQISLVAELKELKANPNKPGRGTCLEAMLSPGEGVFATLLVQDGTLRQGEVVVCGATYGRVRAMYDDLGQPITEAGPSVPVRITGLDEVPNADDPFMIVPDLAQAREVAQVRKARLQVSSLSRREPARLENLSAIKIAELKVILKADFRGSIEAIRKEIEKLQHEEVRARILHAAIGGITESDVQLALTSPEDTIIVGFNAVPDDQALKLAEERGIRIQEYDIIYNLANDIKAALEGKLKPREEVIHLGRAVIRETFKISRVGTIAGCYVTQGTIERSGKVRVIREGIVVYPPSDRTASLESLKRFKEDTREVREGFECGMKVAGYDDIKVGDVIEAYRVEQVQRTL